MALASRRKEVDEDGRSFMKMARQYMAELVCGTRQGRFLAMQKMRALAYERGPRAQRAAIAAVSDAVNWIQGSGPLKVAVLGAIGVASVAALAALATFAVLFFSTTVNAVMLSLVLSISVVGFLMATFFTSLTAIYVGALWAAGITISALTFFSICGMIMAAGWFTCSWGLWNLQQHTARRASHSRAVFTSSSIMTTLLGGFGFIYIKRILEQRQAIREMLLPFLSATVRLRAALSLVSSSRKRVATYYAQKAKKGVACVLYEIFTYFGAMEIKRSKVQHNTKLFGKLHGLCLRVRKAAGGDKAVAQNLDFSTQEFRIILVANMRASDFQEMLESDGRAAKGASGAGEIAAVADEGGSGSGLVVASPSAPDFGFALSMPLTDREAYVDLKKTFLSWSTKLNSGEEIDQIAKMIEELDNILSTFGFDIELDVEAGAATAEPMADAGVGEQVAANAGAGEQATAEPVADAGAGEQATAEPVADARAGEQARAEPVVDVGAGEQAAAEN